MVHGGKLEEARRAYPYAPEPWLDLSTGINPHSWPVERAGLIDWSRLPEDGALAALEAAAAQAFDVPPETVCATPGSEIALRLLHRLDLPRPYRHVAPCYRTHSEALPGSRPIPHTEIEQIEDGTLLLARPANPQGETWQVTSSQARLVIDEAFADAMTDRSVLHHPTTILLRSFGKFYGLPGVRLGFLIAPPSDIAKVRQHLGGWPISAAAITIGLAAYRDFGWQKSTRERLAKECVALDKVLYKRGLQPEGRCPLFRLIRSPDVGMLFERLARHAILTRPFDYDPSWLRIGLPGSSEALDRLDQALKSG